MYVMPWQVLSDTPLISTLERTPRHDNIVNEYKIVLRKTDRRSLHRLKDTYLVQYIQDRLALTRLRDPCT